MVLYKINKLAFIKNKLFLSILGLILSVSIFTPNKLTALTIIKDAEISNTLKKISEPIYKAAQINPDQISIILIQNNEMNAFVINNKSIYFTTELLLQLKSPAMLQAVIAHEVAHIQSGHIIRNRLNLGKLKARTDLGLLAGILIGSTFDTDAGLAVTIGSKSLAQKNYFKHSRGNEITADAISLKLLTEAQINPTSAVKVMDLFLQQEKLLNSNLNKYDRTHPLSNDRKKYMNDIIKQNGEVNYSSDDNIVYLHKRMLAKLSAFLREPKDTLRQIKTDEVNEITLLKKTIALHLKPDPTNAFINLKKLRNLNPDDPYFLELEGQMYLETGQPMRATNSFKEASKLIPDEPTLLVWLGICYLAAENEKNDLEALEVFKSAYIIDPVNPKLLQYLALTYARLNHPGLASLFTAERFFIAGEFKSAESYAKKAERLLEKSSVEWQKAQDILHISSYIGENN